jgi:hypothetical protein
MQIIRQIPTTELPNTKYLPAIKHETGVKMHQARSKQPEATQREAAFTPYSPHFHNPVTISRQN